MRNWLVDLAVCVALLCRTLYPNFTQAHYFECAGALYLTFMIVFLVFGITLALCCPKEVKKQVTPKSDIQRFLREVRLVAVSIVAIYTSHYILGISFLLLFWVLDGLLENIVGAKK